MICNALKRPVNLVQVAESTAQGVAVMLANALDRTSLATYKPAIAHTFTPQPENVTRLQAARERQRDLYRRLYDEKP